MEINEIKFIINYLRESGNECEWIEVKETQIDEEKLGKTISAIANSCLIYEKEYGYIFIGIKDKTWEIIGTDKKFSNFIVKGQDIKLYLKTRLSPDTEFEIFDSIIFENKKINIIKIKSASHTPISFSKEIYFRLGSHNKKIRDFPEESKKLWVKASGFNYEDSIIKKNVSVENILELLDYKSYYKLQNKEISENVETIIQDFVSEGYIRKIDNEYYDILALGGLLFANDLSKVDIGRKSIRIIQYLGKTKSQIASQKFEKKGYANGFYDLIKYLRTILPKEEKIDSSGFRKEYEYYSTTIIRELIVNAIIHQDLSILGNQIKIEIYSDRIEITNPGTPIIDIWRFYDTNRSRNLKLSEHMNRFNMCEELGSGIDRIVEISEKESRFTPKYTIFDNQYTTVKLFKEKNFENMMEDEKLNILFYHCCYSYTLEKYMTNSTLRERFTLSNINANSNKITRLIKKALDLKIIKSGPNKTYIPFWG